MKHSRAIGILCVILASMCYGITPILSNTALKGGLPADFLTGLFGYAPEALVISEARAIPNESVVGFGMAIACVLSLLVCLAERRSLKIRPRQLLELSLFGGGGFTATMLLISYSYFCIPAGTTIVLNFTYPILVAVISAIFFREKLRVPTVLGLLLAVAGVALISGLGAGGNALGNNPALGIPLALLSGLAYAVYFLAGRHASYRELETSVSNVYITGSAAVICLTVALVTGRFCLPPDLFMWLVLLSSGVLGYMVGLRLLLRGIRLLGSTPASALNTLEPVFASLTSMLVFGEAMTAMKGAGIALVLLGAVTCILFTGKAARTAAA